MCIFTSIMRNFIQIQFYFILLHYNKQLKDMNIKEIALLLAGGAICAFLIWLAMFIIAVVG